MVIRRRCGILRHYSYSDRIRYYWPEPEAVMAIDRLFDRLDGVTIPAAPHQPISAAIL